MITFILSLVAASFPQVPCIRSVSAIYDLVKHTMILAVDLELDLRVNIFGAGDDSDAFQDYRLKNDHPLGVPLPIPYAVELHCKD